MTRSLSGFWGLRGFGKPGRVHGLGSGPAEAVAREHGLLIVGLDVIGDHLTEVNVTSPTCMREILDQTGFDIPGMVIDALEARSRAA